MNPLSAGNCHKKPRRSPLDVVVTRLNPEFVGLSLLRIRFQEWSPHAFTLIFAPGGPRLLVGLSRLLATVSGMTDEIFTAGCAESIAHFFANAPEVFTDSFLLPSRSVV